MLLLCQVCGKEIDLTRSRRKPRTCGRECQTAYRRFYQAEKREKYLREQAKLGKAKNTVSESANEAVYVG